MIYDKMILADGTEIPFDSMQSICKIEIETENKYEAFGFWEKFTKENLKSIIIKNKENTEIGSYENMILDHIEGMESENKIHITFYLRQKTKEEALEERVLELEKEQLILLENQNTQDAAIADLGQAVSDFVEGGF